MTGLVRQTLVCTVLVTAAAVSWMLAERAQPAVVDAGFWFEPVTFTSARLGGAISEADRAAIEEVARAELSLAFDGLPLRVSARRDATYRIRVVQAVHDPRMRGRWGVAGASHAVPGLGGQGEVSFDFLAGGATARSPAQATRAEILSAIGRGIGRTAVHELTHQLLPRAPIHDSPDVRSYEYDSAARHEQYFGEMRWNLARPLLAARFGGRPGG
jgi:hypothetical protein